MEKDATATAVDTAKSDGLCEKVLLWLLRLVLQQQLAQFWRVSSGPVPNFFDFQTF